jgi:hypothetical protein
VLIRNINTCMRHRAAATARTASENGRVATFVM